MPLNGEEFEKLRNALCVAFNNDSLKEMFRVELQMRLDLYVGTGDFRTVVFQVIETAEREGWTQKLICAAWKAVPGNKLLNELAAPFLPDAPDGRSDDSRSDNIDPYDALLVREDLPFVNRKKLRMALKKLAERQQEQILVVQGPTQSGKDHSWELIRHVVSSLGGSHELRLIDLNDDYHPPSPYDPSHLAHSILTSIGSQEASLSRRRDKAGVWIRRMREEIIGAIRASNHVWWIVIAGFNRLPSTTEMNDLIESLASYICKQALNCRLILLGYQETFYITGCEWGIEIEEVEYIDRSHVRDYFSKFFQSRGENIPPDAMDEIVSKIFENIGLSPGEPDYTSRLFTVIRETIRLLSQK